MALTPILLGALAVAMAAAGWRTVHQIRLVLRNPDSSQASQHVVRAIRALVLLACSAIFMVAVARPSKTLLVLGAIILAEEIYETGVALIVLGSERRVPEPPPEPWADLTARGLAP